MTATTITLTFGKNKLKNFFKHLIPVVENAFNDSSSKQDSTTWKTKWKTWMDRGLATADTRNKLVQILFDGTYKSKNVSETMYDIITLLRTELPPVSQFFDFDQNPQDLEVWTVTCRPYHRVNDDEVQEEPWSTVAQKSSKKQPNREPDKVITKSEENTISSNAFAAFTDTLEEEEVDERKQPSQDNVHVSPLSSDGISYDTSSHYATIDNLKYFSDEMKTSPLTTSITQDEINQVCSDILTKRADADADLMYKWIFSSASAIDTTLLQHHRQLAKHENSLLELKPAIENMKNQPANTIAEPILALIDNMEKTVVDLEQKVKKMKNESFATMRDINKQLNKTKSTVAVEESNAILHINTAYNTCKQELDIKLKKGEDLIASINALKAITKETQKTIRVIEQEAERKAKLQYDMFEEQLQVKIDEEREELRDWIANQTGMYAPDRRLMQELQDEKDKLTAERMLMQTTRKEINEWFSHICTISNHTPPIHPPTSTQPTQQPTNVNNPAPSPVPSATFNTSDGVNMNQPLPPDTFVHYKDKITDVYAFIMNQHPPTFQNGYWHYEIYTSQGVELQQCSEQFMTVVIDHLPNQQHTTSSTNSTTPPPPPVAQTPPRVQSTAHSNYSSPYQRICNQHRQTSTNMQNQNNRQARRHWNPPSENEFEYPIGSVPCSIWADTLLKHSSKWDLDKVKSVDDLPGLWHTLQVRLEAYNIHLKKYEDLTPDSGVEAITPSNCTNYDVAKKQMSKALLLFFDERKEDLFEHYTAPKAFIAAFKPMHDGLGFAKHLITQKHPKMKEIIDGEEESRREPVFADFNNIYEFINAYIEWITDEKLRGRPFYSDREKINYVLTQLDSNYSTAIKKIQLMLADVYANPLQPKAFPPQLKLTPVLGLYIVKLLDTSQRVAIEQQNSSSGTIKAVRNPYQQRAKKEKEKKKVDFDLPLEWTVIPGARCTACGKSNHNVYSTGCPSLAIYANCKKFYDSMPKEKIQPIQDAFEKYQKEIRKKMKTRRNADRRVLRAVAPEMDEDDMKLLQNKLMEDYKEDFLEDQYLDENPYLTLDDEKDD